MKLKSKKTKQIEKLEREISRLKDDVRISDRRVSERRSEIEAMNEKSIIKRLEYDKTLENHKENIENLYRKTKFQQVLIFSLIFAVVIVIAATSDSISNLFKNEN